MERVYSIDDILGTFWKLDTQGPDGGGGPGGFPGSFADLQRLQREGGMGGLTRSGSVHRMSRSSSEWAFQEFLKEHVAATGALDRSGSAGTEGFGLPHATSRDGGLPRFTPSLERLDKLLNDDSQDTSPCNEEGGQTPRMPRGSHAMLPPSFIPPRSLDALGSPHGEPVRQVPNPVSEPRGTTGLVETREVEAKESVGRGKGEGEERGVGGGGVRPLFSGIPEEEAAANPQEYEKVLKQRLAMACAMASSRVSLSPAGPHFSSLSSLSGDR